MSLSLSPIKSYIIICCAACFLNAGSLTPAKAQDIYGIENIEALYSRLQTNRITFDYSCTLSDVPIDFKGNAVIQGECYRVEANETLIICNGTVRWSMDNETKEVYIENVEENEVEYLLTYRNDFKEFRFKNVHYLPSSDDLSVFNLDVLNLDPKEWVIVDLRK